ncbi:MAG: indole-3-glycerol phosphate synthase TrpC [Myxococcaceae bacterium]
MSFLADILKRKEEEVSARRTSLPERELLARLADAPPVRSLHAALSPRGGPLRVIAEVKRASPSLGVLRGDVDAAALALRYAEAGAAAISVLTDGPGFGGSLADLTAVRRVVPVPVLRKDFILDRYQLLEARAAGADAALLLVVALGRERTRALLDAAHELGLEALVECHAPYEVDDALDAGARIVGINNRDLSTFHIDLAVSESLLPRLPEAVRGVAESGVKGVVEARRLREAGAANVLVGEALVKADDPGALLRALGAL